MKRFYRFFRPGGFAFLLAIASCLLAVSDAAFAYSGGITGQSTAGCTCHSPGQSANTSLSFSSSSGSFNVSPGSSLTITLTVAHSSQAAAGTNISAVNSSNQNSGTLAPVSGSGLQASGNELTHTSPKDMSGGEASFSFTWTAPATPGTYTIRAAGNAVNDNGSNSGDYYNTGTQTITVVSSPTIAVTSPNGGEEWCAGSSQNITWTSANVANVKIELSSDGGGSYPTTLVASTPAAAGSWAWNIPGGQTLGTQYKVRISDVTSAATNDVSNGNFGIKGATAISTHPVSQTGCQGTAVSLSVVASGANLSYQWRKGGNNITGANSATYTINSPDVSHNGSYDVVVTGSCGAAVTSNAATLTIKGKPTITNPPASFSGCAGDLVQLSVTATGEDLTYQWRREGTPIPNATQPTYTIPSLAPGDTGRYDVVVSGSCNPSATSNFAAVRILAAPAINSVSQSQSVCENSPVTLSVESPGAQGYIWKKNGAVLTGANSSTYSIASANTNAQGEYTVTVIGVCDSTTSQPIVLTVIAKPSITQQPANLNVIEGGAIALTVTATGANVKYQWKKNGTVIAGSTQATLNIASAAVNDAGTYTVAVSNNCGEVVSANAVVTVTPAGPGPVLLLSQSSIDFGPLALAGEKEMTITVTNGGTEELSISAMNIEGDNGGDFTFVNKPATPVLLEPAGTVNITVRFSPAAEGARTARIAFTSNAATNPQLALTGTGAVPRLESVAGTTIDFGKVNISETKNMDITFKNTGLIPVSITGYGISGDQSEEFDFGTVTNKVLQPNEEIVVPVTYQPTILGPVAAELFLLLEGTEPATIQITGEGMPSTSVRETALASVFTVTPNPITEGTTIRVATAEPTLELAVVDAMGRTVRTFSQLVGTSDVQTLWWDGRDNSGTECAAGIYRLVLTGRMGVQSVPVVIVR